MTIDSPEQLFCQPTHGYNSPDAFQTLLCGTLHGLMMHSDLHCNIFGTYFWFPVTLDDMKKAGKWNESLVDELKKVLTREKIKLIDDFTFVDSILFWKMKSKESLNYIEKFERSVVNKNLDIENYFSLYYKLELMKEHKLYPIDQLMVMKRKSLQHF